MPFDLYVFGPERYGLLELFNGSAPVNPDFLAQNQPLLDHHDFLDDGDHQCVPFLADVRRRLDHAIDRNALDFDIDALKLLLDQFLPFAWNGLNDDTALFALPLGNAQFLLDQRNAHFRLAGILCHGGMIHS
jgi:hypothetical protein